MTKETNIPISLWRKLFEKAFEFFSLSPWKWMYEVDVFGVENSYSDEIDYCSVLGANQIDKGLIIYKGRSGFAAFEEHFKNTQTDSVIPDVLHQNCLKLIFKRASELEPFDRDILNQCGYELSSDLYFPSFRDFFPGLAPWIIEKSSQALFLLEALEQCIFMAKRVKIDKDLLDYSGIGKYILVRKCVFHEKEKSWKDEWIEVRPYVALKPPIKVNRIFLLSNITNVPTANTSWLIDIFYFPNPLGGPKERPYYPQMLIVVNIETGIIIGHDLFKPNELLELLQVRLIDIIKRLKYKPKKIYLPTFEAYLSLEDIADIMGIILEIDEEVTLIEEIKSSIFGSLTV